MSTLKVGEIKHESFTGTTQLKLDSAGRLMVGTDTKGQADADDFTVANSGSGGITIRTGNSSNGNIFFSDATSGSAEYAGYLQYKHDHDRLDFGTATSTRMTIDSIGRLLMGGTSPEMNENGFNEIVIGGKSEGAAITLQDDNSNVKGGLFSSDANLAMIVRTVTNHPLEFRTNNTHRMRLDTSGNLVIKGSATSDNNRMQIRVNDTQNEFRGSSNSGTSRGFAFYASNTNVSEIATLDSDGLKFGSDTAAANALDDYEEGTWTPDIRVHNNLSTAGQFSYTSRSGTYTKIGRKVHITGFFRISNFYSYTGNLYMFGLPFAPMSSHQPLLNFIGDGVNLGGDNQMQMFMIIEGGNNRAVVGHQRNTGWSHLTRSELSGNGGMYLSGSYYV